MKEKTRKNEINTDYLAKERWNLSYLLQKSILGNDEQAIQLHEKLDKDVKNFLDRN